MRCDRSAICEPGLAHRYDLICEHSVKLSYFQKKFCKNPTIPPFPIELLSGRDKKTSRLPNWAGKEVNSYGEIFFL